jgi:hypothetical protein
MKRILLSIVLLSALASNAPAAFPTNESVHTNELDKLSDDFSDFRFRWTGYNSQSVTFTIATTAGVGYNMAGYTAAFTATKRTSAGTNVIYVSKGAADCTVSGSNVSFTVTYAEVPPNGTYNAELILMDSGNALYRTLGRGTVFVRESLYASSGTNFPFPSLTSTLGDLGDVTITSGAQGDILYRGASVWQNLAAGTAGYVLTSGGAGANPSWSASGGTSTSFTNYIAGDTEAVVTGDARSGSNVLSIGSTIARDTEIADAMGTATNSFAPISVTIAAASNAAMSGVAASYLPLAGGAMTGPVNFGAFTQTVSRLSGSDTPSSGADGSITISSSHVKLYPGSDGFAGGEVQIYNDDIEQTPELVFHAPLNSATPVFDMNLEVKTNLTVGGTMTLNSNGSNWVHNVGTYLGTNGVYWITGSTTNWLLF